MIRIESVYKVSVVWHLMFKIMKRMFLLLALSVLAAILYGFVTRFEDMYFMVSYICIWLAGIAYVIIILGYQAKKSIIKQLQGNYKPSEVVFSEFGMSHMSYNYYSGINSFVPYASFSRVWLTKSRLTLLARNVCFAISRFDLEQEKEQELLALLKSKLDDKVFDGKVPVRGGKHDRIPPATLPPPRSSFAPLHTCEFDFDKAEEIRFKKTRLKSGKIKKGTFRKVMFVVSLLIAAGGLMGYLHFDYNYEYLRFAFIGVQLSIVYVVLIVFAKKTAQKPDILDRDGKKIQISIANDILTYKILGDKKVAHYFGLTEMMFVKETNYYFAFYVGAFQPMLLGKQHLTTDQKLALRQQIMAICPAKYSFWPV